MTITPEALLGPLLLAVTVKVIFCPTLGVGLLTVFDTDKSATGTGTVVTLEVLLELIGSVYVPEMVAVFV